MGIFSLDWFKSEKSKEKEILEVELLKKTIEKVTVETPNTPFRGAVEVKIYKKLKLINDTLTIVLNDGSIISKSNATQEDFKKARSAQFESELFKIACSSEGIEEKCKYEEELNKTKALIDGIEILKALPDFKVEENTVYLKGINRSLPQLLVERFVEIANKYNHGVGISNEFLQIDEEYQALKRFIMWCFLNPRAEVTDKLYEFLVKNSFRITKQGFFTALRNVVTVEKDNELVKFVSNSYNKVKAVWKKKPNRYEVIRFQGEYKFEPTKSTSEEHNGEWIGNLEELYLDLPNMAENRFTDAHTGTFDIRIGQVVNMPSEKCNWNTADCGHSGLHFTADQINYVGCGDTSVLVLINPMKVVGIGETKGRCYEYLPIMTVPREESTTILHDLDFDTLELDEDFAIKELENLATKAMEGFAVEAKKHSFNIPQLSSIELTNIVLSLEDMKTSISKRVVGIDEEEEE